MNTTDTTCAPETRVTKSLLGYGIIAGPIYLIASVTQGLVRDGFDFARHQWSLLANGDFGWIHILNFVLVGLMTIAAAAGLRRAMPEGRGRTWGPRLIAIYGASLIAAGIFRADPVPGFPPGTRSSPDGAVTVSWHGMLHFAAGVIGFGCLIAACFVLARRFRAEGKGGWAVFSTVTGALFLAGFIGVAAGAGRTVTNLAFTATIVLVWTWISATSLHFYRKTARTSNA